MTRIQNIHEFGYNKDFQTRNSNQNHSVYAAANLKDFTLKGGITIPILEHVRKTEYQYKYQGQERQDELGLNWQSNYAFSENRVTDGVELEGLERVPANEVWDLGRSLVTASGVGNFDKNGSYKVTSINNNLVSMHLLTSGSK